MNDIIKPFDIDLTKKLHGHVRVETRSRWTGRVVDSQEKDNLITNAVQREIMSLLWMTTVSASTFYSPIETRISPLYEKLLGGLLLFDNTLTEQASNMHFPSSAKLVGYAGQAANSTDTMCGSLNSAESTFISNGFTTVWDFLTSQANGTIASLGRTSFYFPSYPAIVTSSPGSIKPSSISPSGTMGGEVSFSSAGTVAYLGWDETNKYLFLTPFSNVTVGGVTYYSKDIYKVQKDFYKVCLINAVPPAAKLSLVKTLTSSDGNTSAYNWVYDKYDNCFLYATGTTLHIVSAVDGTHTTKTLTGTSGGAFVVTENYYWRATGSTIYQIQRTNVANVQSISVAAAQLAPSENDIVFAGNSSNENWIVYPDGATIKIQTATSALQYSPRQAGPYYITGGLYSEWASNPHYLGTIANLDSPVTKTSSQTMKITYTLTEA